MTLQPCVPPVRFLGLKIAYSWKCNGLCAHRSVSAGLRMTVRMDRDVAPAYVDDAGGAP